MSLMDILMGDTSSQERLSFITSLTGGGLGSLISPGGDYGGTGSHWEQVAQQMAMRQGYSPEDWKKLDYIISHESNWDPNAVNQGSGAWGIPQILPSAHPDIKPGSLNPRQQINWLLDYIQGRYGGIGSAYSHKQSTGWY